MSKYLLFMGKPGNTAKDQGRVLGYLDSMIDENIILPIIDKAAITQQSEIDIYFCLPVNDYI